MQNTTQLESGVYLLSDFLSAQEVVRLGACSRRLRSAVNDATYWGVRAGDYWQAGVPALAFGSIQPGLRVGEAVRGRIFWLVNERENWTVLFRGRITTDGFAVTEGLVHKDINDWSLHDPTWKHMTRGDVDRVNPSLESEDAFVSYARALTL